MAAAAALVLLLIGGLLLIVGGFMMLFAAFQQGILWLLGCLFIPFVQLIFLIMYWAEAKKSFFIQLAGAALCGLGVAIGGADISRFVDAAKDSQPTSAEAAPPEPEPAAPAPPPPDLRPRAVRIAADCKAELGMLCHGRESEKSQLRCLRENEGTLSAACREGVAANP